jgi:hypothetical protein
MRTVVTEISRADIEAACKLQGYTGDHLNDQVDWLYEQYHAELPHLRRVTFQRLCELVRQNERRR